MLRHLIPIQHDTDNTFVGGNHEAIVSVVPQGSSGGKPTLVYFKLSSPDRTIAVQLDELAAIISLYSN